MKLTFPLLALLIVDKELTQVCSLPPACKRILFHKSKFREIELHLKKITVPLDLGHLEDSISRVFSVNTFLRFSDASRYSPLGRDQMCPNEIGVKCHREILIKVNYCKKRYIYIHTYYFVYYIFNTY